MSRSTNTYSGINLLDKILEFTEMSPNSAEWNLKSLKANPPRQIRLRQIESLLAAFCAINTNENLLSKAKSIFFDNQKITITSFLHGDFIKTRSIDEYSEIIQFIKDFVKTRLGDADRKREIRIEELAFIFPVLIDFKKQIRSMLTFNSGWLEASSDVSLFSIYLTNSIAEKLVGKYGELDYVIERFINSKGLIFTEEEMIDKYNFPKEDLNEIDSDFM